jgi:hypothetical protein
MKTLLLLGLLLLSCTPKDERKYYSSNDFYHLHADSTLTLLEHFKTYQQTTDVTCGPSCALMALDYIGRLGDHNEMSLKALRGATQDTTYLRHLLHVFDAIGNLHYRSTFDYRQQDITPALLLDFLQQGAPILIGTNEWGGHWQIIIGYDTHNTPTLEDDVLILADPYDRTDHCPDGYLVYPLENLFYGNWRNYYDPDFNWGLFVALFPQPSSR